MCIDRLADVHWAHDVVVMSLQRRVHCPVGCSSIPGQLSNLMINIMVIVVKHGHLLS